MLGDDFIFGSGTLDAWEYYASRGSGRCHGGACRALPPETQADGCREAGDFVCHSGVNFWAIGAYGCPKAGDFVCHSSVVFSAIKADGCPEVGDFVCHSSVDFSTIKAGGCPKAGDFVCHSSVDFSFGVAGSSTGGPPELRTVSLSCWHVVEGCVVAVLSLHIIQIGGLGG